MRVGRPNPAHTSITLELNEQSYFDKFSVYNTSGIKIAESQTTQCMNKINIDLGGFKDGMYVIVLWSGDGSVVTKKFIVHSP